MVALEVESNNSKYDKLITVLCSLMKMTEIEFAEVDVEK